MNRDLPLHLACETGHKECVEVLLQPISGLEVRSRGGEIVCKHSGPVSLFV